MSKILKIPNEIVKYELEDKDVEIVILHQKMERFAIKKAPSLKKIISFSEYIVFGPEVPNVEIPALNRAKNLNEIITFGYIQFNTKTLINGKEVSCAWTSTDGVPPTLTSIGSDYFGDFPCYYYDLNSKAKNYNSRLVDAYPLIRDCSSKFYEFAIKNALENPDEVSEPVLRKSLVIDKN